jgi:hypothetical protein
MQMKLMAGASGIGHIELLCLQGQVHLVPIWHLSSQGWSSDAGLAGGLLHNALMPTTLASEEGEKGEKDRMVMEQR